MVKVVEAFEGAAMTFRGCAEPLLRCVPPGHKSVDGRVPHVIYLHRSFITEKEIVFGHTVVWKYGGNGSGRDDRMQCKL